MKITVDLLASTVKSGGTKLHAQEVVSAWAELYPDDQLILVGGPWVREFFSPSEVRIITWPNESIVFRAVGQLVVSLLVAIATRSDLLFSLTPVVSPLARRIPTICVEHDWRHLITPDEFSRAQHFYRRLWQLSARRADVAICISEKTRVETIALAPSTKSIVVENGRDHARRWEVARPSPGIGGNISIVTFGHHGNKRPELVIRALTESPLLSYPTATLVILGARGEYAQSLRTYATSLSVGSRVELPGFVSDAKYRELVSNSACVVMASTDEGFGLPIAEANYFGIPAVVTADSGMADIHRGRVLVANPSSHDLARTIELALSHGYLPPDRSLDSTWRSAVKSMRDVACATISERLRRRVLRRIRNV